MSNFNLFESTEAEIFQVRTKSSGPAGSLPITEDMLLNSPSGDLFGLTQNAGMGWNPAEAGRKQFLILSTQGGLRAPDGKPIALGYHTGHWEIGLLVQAAAEEFRQLETIPFAGYCSDPCDGRTQGTTGMFDSLPYRNDAAIMFRRLARSLPQRRGVLGIATCDKGLPAMMMAVAGLRDLPGVIVPGGVTLPAGGRGGRRHGANARHAFCARAGLAGRSGGTGLPRLRFARRRLPVSRHGGHVAGRRRGAGTFGAALRAGPVGPAGLAGPCAPVRPRAVPARRTKNFHARYSDRREH